MNGVFTRTRILDLHRFRAAEQPEVCLVHKVVDELNAHLAQNGSKVELRFINECNAITPANLDRNQGYIEIVRWGEKE